MTVAYQPRDYAFGCPGMVMTDYGRAWLRNLLQGVSQRPPLFLQLGLHDWGGELFQRLQNPALTVPINRGSVLLPQLTAEYREAAILDEREQPLAVMPLHVSQHQAAGLIEDLRVRVLMRPGTFVHDGRLSTPSFANSCRLVNGAVDCSEEPAEEPEELFADDELATEVPDGFWGGADDDDDEGDATAGGIEPDATANVPISIGVRNGRRVRVGWKLPRTYLFMGIEPGFYLHFYKTTRMHEVGHG